MNRISAEKHTKDIMRYIGPGMLFFHPLMTLHHLYIKWFKKNVLLVNNFFK